MVASSAALVLLESVLRRYGFTEAQYKELLLESVTEHAALLRSLAGSNPDSVSSKGGPLSDSEDDEGSNLRTEALEAIHLFADTSVRSEESETEEADEGSESESEEPNENLQPEGKAMEISEGVGFQPSDSRKRRHQKEHETSHADDGNEEEESIIQPSDAMINDAVAANSADGKVNIEAVVSQLASRMRGVPAANRAKQGPQTDGTHIKQQGIALNAAQEGQNREDDHHKRGHRL